MIKKLLTIAMSLLCSVALLTSCGGAGGDGSIDPTAETALALLSAFEFDHTISGGYKLNHIQTVSGKETNSRYVELSLSSGGSKGVLVETVKSLNPEIEGEEYISNTTTVTFNGSEVKENGKATDAYTVSELVSLALFDISAIENKLDNVKYENNVLSFNIPENYASAVIGDASGVGTVSISVTTNADCTSILGVAIEYSRNGVSTLVELSIN